MSAVATVGTRRATSLQTAFAQSRINNAEIFFATATVRRDDVHIVSTKPRSQNRGRMEVAFNSASFNLDKSELKYFFAFVGKVVIFATERNII